MHDIVIVDERRKDEREQIREGREQRFPRLQKFRPRHPHSRIVRFKGRKPGICSAKPEVTEYLKYFFSRKSILAHKKFMHAQRLLH